MTLEHGGEVSRVEGQATRKPSSIPLPSPSLVPTKPPSSPHHTHPAESRGVPPATALPTEGGGTAMAAAATGVPTGAVAALGAVLGVLELPASGGGTLLLTWRGRGRRLGGEVGG